MNKHDPNRSDAELIEILLRHRPELADCLTSDLEREWLEHVKACGGYERTEWGQRL